MTMTFLSKAVVKYDWLYIPKNELTKKDIEEINKLYISIPSFSPNALPKKLLLYSEDSLYYKLPREIKIGIPEVKLKKATINFGGKLRPHQELLAKRIYDSYDTTGGGIIKASTGSGKTVLSLGVAANLGLKTLVIVPTKVLLNQWKEAIKTFCGFTPGIIQQNNCDFSQPITIGMLHTLSKKYHAQIKELFGLVIFDEVHTIPTQQFSAVAPLFACRYRLGLSATPDRVDKADILFKMHIGKIIATYNKVSHKPIIYVKHYSSPKTDSSGCMYGNRFNLSRYLNKIQKDQQRTVYIAQKVEQSYRNNRYVCVLSDRLDLLRDVYKLLRKVGITDIGILSGNVKNIDNNRIILATYKCAGMGWDYPELDTLILATPRANIEQAVGRLTRGDKYNVPIVLDIVDINAPMMINYYKKREKVYKKLGCNIKFMRR